MSSSTRSADFAALDEIPVLGHLVAIETGILPEIEQRLSLTNSPEEKVWLLELHAPYNQWW